MNPTQFRILQDQAQSIVVSFLRKYKFPDSFPVPIETIAREEYGLRCISARLGRFGKNTSGRLDPQHHIVYVDERCNLNQYVFRVAHELGHWVLHAHGDLHRLSGGTSLGAVFSSNASVNKKSWAEKLEREADQFASAILMPLSILTEEAHKYQVVDAKVLRDLALKFAVSNEVMLRRICDLSDNGFWDRPSINKAELRRVERGIRWAQANRGGRQDSVDLVSRSSEAGGNPSAVATVSRNKARSDKARIRALCDFLARLGAVETRDGTSLALRLAACKPVKVKDRFQEAEVLVACFRRLGSRLVTRVGFQKPFIIEFAGTPNAGKDTLINIIVSYLEDIHGYKVRVINEAVRGFSRDPMSKEEVRLDRAVPRVVDLLYEANYENPGNCDFVIINRGILDGLAFLDSMCKCGRVSSEYHRINSDYLLSKADLQDLTLLFLISPEESIQREMISNRNHVLELFESDRRQSQDHEIATQSVHNLEMLRQLNESYLAKQSLPIFENRVLIVGSPTGDDITVVEKAQKIRRAILPKQHARKPCPARVKLASSLRQKSQLALPLQFSTESSST